MSSVFHYSDEEEKRRRAQQCPTAGEQRPASELVIYSYTVPHAGMAAIHNSALVLEHILRGGAGQHADAITAETNSSNRIK